MVEPAGGEPLSIPLGTRLCCALTLDGLLGFNGLNRAQLRLHCPGLQAEPRLLITSKPGPGKDTHSRAHTHTEALKLRPTYVHTHAPNPPTHPHRHQRHEAEVLTKLEVSTFFLRMRLVMLSPL